VDGCNGLAKNTGSGCHVSRERERQDTTLLVHSYSTQLSTVRTLLTGMYDKNFLYVDST
jgi:hypothetical protein